jgi:uncharacterized protein YcgI (DUF1989 family)
MEVPLPSWLKAARPLVNLKTRIPQQQGTSFILKKNHLLKVTDTFGSQVSDLFCVFLETPCDALSSGRSIDYADTIYLTAGHKLYSNRSRAMLEILTDTCGRHDFLLTPCNAVDCTPSCFENLASNLALHGVPEDRITTTFNIFMNVAVNSKGAIQIDLPASKPGDHVIFRACEDLIVGLTACSHPGTNGGALKPIDYEIYLGESF